MRRIFLWLGLVAVAALAVTYLSLSLLVRPVPDHPFFATPPLIVAHRGGSGLRPENTLLAFREAVSLGVDVLEMDVHSTRDEVLVVMHDDTVDRTTDGSGAIHDHSLVDLQKLDAGYQWSNDDGATHAYRGQGLQIPTLEEVLQAFPDERLNVEIKQFNPSITEALCHMIREHDAENRVLVASFDPGTMADFRNQCPEVATSGTAPEIRWYLTLQTLYLGGLYRGPAEAFEVPPRLGDLEVVTSDFVTGAHHHNVHVLVWTVNTEDEMKRLLDLGVDGILTDYPDRLIHLLHQVGREEPRISNDVSFLFSPS